MYFSGYGGQRTAFVVLDLPDSSDTIPFAEPLFMELNANLEFVPVLNADDLRKGLAKAQVTR